MAGITHIMLPQQSAAQLFGGLVGILASRLDVDASVDAYNAAWAGVIRHG